jgi:hypothetical protein
MGYTRPEIGGGGGGFKTMRSTLYYHMLTTTGSSRAFLIAVAVNTSVADRPYSHAVGLASVLHGKYADLTIMQWVRPLSFMIIIR